MNKIILMTLISVLFISGCKSEQQRIDDRYFDAVATIDNQHRAMLHVCQEAEATRRGEDKVYGVFADRVTKRLFPEFDACLRRVEKWETIERAKVRKKHPKTRHIF